MVEPTQSGTFVGGLVSGFQAGEGIQRRRRQAERQEQQFEAQQELQALQTEAQKVQLNSAKAQQRRDKALRHVETALAADAAGNDDLAGKEFQEYLSTLDMSTEDFAPEFARAADTLEKAFKQPESVPKEQAVQAANRVFRNRIKQGVGEKTTRDGKEVTITDKEITEVAPAPTDDGQGNKIEPGVMARMRVTGTYKDENGDEQTLTWRAPLTANRSSDPDDPAQGVPVDEIARQVIGRKKMMQGIAQSPRFRRLLQLARVRAGGKPPEPNESLKTIPGEALGLEGGIFQQNSRTGEITQVVEPPDEQGQFDVVSGDQLPNSNVQGGLFKRNRQTGEVTKLVAPDDAGQKGGAGSIDTSTFNSISDEVDRNFETASDRFGAVFTPEERKKALLNAKAQSQRIYVDADGELTPAEAARRGVQAVMADEPTISQEDARIQAEKEYEQQFGENYYWQDDPDKDQWVEQRAKELRSTSAPTAASGGGKGRLSSAGAPKQKPSSARMRSADARGDNARRSNESASPNGQSASSSKVAGTKGGTSKPQGAPGNGRQSGSNQSPQEGERRGARSGAKVDRALSQAKEALESTPDLTSEDLDLVRRALIQKGVPEDRAQALIAQYQ